MQMQRVGYVLQRALVDLILQPVPHALTYVTVNCVTCVNACGTGWRIPYFDLAPLIIRHPLPNYGKQSPIFGQRSSHVYYAINGSRIRAQHEC